MFGIHLDRSHPRRVSAHRARGVLDPFRAHVRFEHLSLPHGVIAATGSSSSWAPPFEANGIITVSWSRLDNRNDLADRLGESRNATDNQLIDRAFGRWKAGAPAHLRGAFCAARVDPTAREVTLLRDQVGVHPLFFRRTSAGVTAATTPAWFWRLDGSELAPSPEWMIGFAAGHSSNGDRTPWPSVVTVEPGTTVTIPFSLSKPVRTRRYHRFVDPGESGQTAPESVSLFRNALETAVERRLDDERPTAVHSTGGLDSSTCLGVAAMSSQRDSANLISYGIARYRDESAFIPLTAKHHNLRPTAIFDLANLPPVDVEGMRRRQFLALGFPPADPSGPSHDELHQWCVDHGARSLLSGFGGDQVVSSDAWLVLAELADRQGVGAAAGVLRRRGALQLLRLPRALRRSRRFHRAHLDIVSGVRERELRRLPLMADTPRIATPQDQRPAAATHNAAVIDALENTIGARLESTALMAHAAGLEYRYPLLDVDLIETYLRTPLIEKRNHGTGRWLHRRAVRGAVPDPIRWQPTKYMGPPVHDERSPIREPAMPRFITDPHPTLGSLFDVERARSIVRSGTTTLDREMLSRLDHLNLWLSTDPG